MKANNYFNCNIVKNVKINVLYIMYNVVLVTCVMCMQKINFVAYAPHGEEVVKWLLWWPREITLLAFWSMCLGLSNKYIKKYEFTKSTVLHNTQLHERAGK